MVSNLGEFGRITSVPQNEKTIYESSDGTL